MSFRHERRRRLLADEANSEGEDAPDASLVRLAGHGSDARPQRTRYADTVRPDLDRRCHQLLPSSYLTLALVAFGGLVVVGLLTMSHVWAATLADALSAEELAVVSFQGVRNLSHWFASTVLSLATLSAAFIYSIRRHRVDDYHGRYRIWIWTALACLLASLDETTDVGRLAHGACRRAADLSGIGESRLWAISLAIVCGVLAVRLVIEVRHSGLALVALVLATASYLLGITVDADWLPLDPDMPKLPLVRGLALAGYVLLLTALLSYARDVSLEISGVTPAPKRRKTKRSAETEATAPVSKPALHLRTDLEPTGSVAAAPAAQRSTASKTDSPAGAVAGSVESGRLSRAERRRARRQTKMAG
jgi:hypothetical protein